MKHTIRQHGQITQIECEFGSGLFDKNGREIIEGDIINNGVNTLPVKFSNGSLLAFFNGEGIGLYQHFCDGFEVVGHVEDDKQ